MSLDTHEAGLAFQKLGYSPRDGQLEAVTKVVDAFRRGKRNVMLDAPTGSGKSFVAAAVAMIMPGRAVVSTATNTLAGQYQRDFKASDQVGFVYGAANYPCKLREELFEDRFATADRCYKKSKFYRQAFSSPSPVCGDCEFAKSRADKGEKKLVVTNYSYFILDRLFISTFENPYCFDPTGTFIFDEAHLINEMFANHSVIHFSETRAKEFLKDCEAFAGAGSAVAYGNSFDIILENCRKGTIGEKNAHKFMKMLCKFYSFMMDVLTNRALWTKEEAEYDRLKSLYRKYHGMFCKIEDAFKYEFELAVTVEKSPPSLSIKPVFVKESFKHLAAERNLFMSATLNPEMLIDTLSLDRSETEVVQIPYAFNSDDKEVVAVNDTVRLNMLTMGCQITLDRLGKICRNILATHPNEKGTISTTSFRMAGEIANRIGEGHHKVFLHSSNIRSDEMIKRFMSYSGPAVLISPSLFEGVDLPGDASRFQLITKCPFYSLGDRRNKIISMRYRPVYNMMTTVRLVQALGRSTRFKGDKSVSYLVDANALRAFKSKHNVWKDQFKLREVSQDDILDGP